MTDNELNLPLTASGGVPPTFLAVESYWQQLPDTPASTDAASENECLRTSGSNGPAAWSLVSDSRLQQRLTHAFILGSSKSKKPTVTPIGGPAANELPWGVGYIYHTEGVGHVAIWVRDGAGTHVYSFGPNERNGGPGWGVYNYENYRQYIGPDDFVVHLPGFDPLRVRECVLGDIGDQYYHFNLNNCVHNATDALNGSRIGDTPEIYKVDTPGRFHNERIDNGAPILWGPGDLLPKN